MSFRRNVGVKVLVCLFLAWLPSIAQNVTGSISGVVQDPQGAVVPNAKVTLINEAQGAGSARQATTNPEGAFVFTPLVAGTYTLTVEVTGFKIHADQYCRQCERPVGSARDRA